MPSITINPNDPKSIEAALNTEWLLTNGLGGYAMGTALGVNTRRYHGLLVAATKPPVGRIVALHSMIEQLVIPKDDGTEEVIDLSTQQFGDDAVLHPNGWRILSEVRIEPNSRIEWLYTAGSITIRKSLSFIDRRNGVFLDYLIRGVKQPTTLTIRPFTPMRDFHGLMHEHQSSGIATVMNNGHVTIVANSSDLYCFGRADLWKNESQRWRNFAYRADQSRGQDWIEDQWSAGMFDCPLDQNKETQLAFVFSTELPAQSGWPSSKPGPRPVRKSARDHVVAAADQFVVKRRMAEDWATSVIAGYPWFGDWGRDTMIALPGLMLCTGRRDEARSTLLTFARSMKNGLIPNLFDDYGGADHYNTVDASLWFVHAAHQLWKSTSKNNEELLVACRKIIAAYRRGTDFNIKMDERDELIAAGDPSTQLTWMDAKRDNIAFTPRNGKPVEINALWYNALRCVAEMTDDESERKDSIALSEQVAKSFREQFWWRERNCLHDVLSPSTPEERQMGFSPSAQSAVSMHFEGDRRLRPNQIFAVSLPFSPLTREQKLAVVNIVGERLLTPFGLRTLDRDDPQYRGRYQGNLFDRDSAYHQGTVWPWLIGPYCEALLRVNDFSDDAKRKAAGIVQPLIDEMSNASGGRCINQIAEVYDGDPPHRPSGCPAQAWSIAEVLRIKTIIEDSKPR